ncbi:hypothetical protein [Endozoicomonas sp. YOMI1]|uniref:hypothetical protein n=1 Tax=Endozoicomonas sp. YOMI1 TaxID=2828739 RepID=UPI0021496B39|nr:hypothetical protein [Endozoicomonas sp. YOMI1]
MQPNTLSSQGMTSFVEGQSSNTGKPEDSQHQSVAYARNVIAAHGHLPALTHPGHGSEHAVTGERPADDADTPPDTGLIARVITETEVLSARNEPLPHCGIKVITAGNYRPDALSKPIGKTVVCDDSDLPCGHTYQPYFWLSRFAHRLLTPTIGQYAGIQFLVINQLRMSEAEARQDFLTRFEYRLVDYGFTGPDASGGPEKNYGVFASTPVAEGDLLGIYSGIGYVLNKPSWLKKNRNWRPEYLHQKFTEDMPDFMSYCRTMMAGLRGKEQTQRTLSKYTQEGAVNDLLSMVAILPDNERYTPMHFVNSASRTEDVNTSVEFIAINTGFGNFTIPVSIAIKGIAAGQELLMDYYVDPDGHQKSCLAGTAAEEKARYNKIMQSRLGIVRKLSDDVPGKTPISPFVAAPAYYVSEEVRKHDRRSSRKRTSLPRH